MNLKYVVEEISKRLKSLNLAHIWDGFYLFDFAIYNDEKVYMYSNEEVSVFKWTDQFIGNTSIKFNNEYVAIWKLNECNDDVDLDKLTASILHEMFHCYQFQIGDKRWANEVLGAEYPLNIENTACRIQERKIMYKYLIEENLDNKNKLLQECISYRSKRSSILKELIEYEKGIESIEGTAYYVEYTALKMLTGSDDCLLKYIDSLLSTNKNVLNIRSTSYVAGLVMCLILDDNIDNWQKEYMACDKYLYDYLLKKIDIEISDIEVEGIEHAEKIINDKKFEIEELFEDFYKNTEKDTLEGEFTLIAFDPMNIIKKDNEVFHKHMVKVTDGDKERFIWGPLITCIKSSMFSIDKIIYDKSNN